MTRQSKKESKDRMERLDVRRQEENEVPVRPHVCRTTNRCNPVMTVGLRIKCLCDAGMVLYWYGTSIVPYQYYHTPAPKNQNVPSAVYHFHE
eukprot:scaffold31404_cov156-Amphora_coffeaeformis.AAC.1